jgi:hypothetical protein
VAGANVKHRLAGNSAKNGFVTIGWPEMVFDNHPVAGNLPEHGLGCAGFTL